MPLIYNDPWKDDKFARITGDFSDANAKFGFHEVKVYEIENGYVLAGWFSYLSGVTRKFKPERNIEPGLCSLTIHSAEYEVNKKDDDGNWTKVKYQPSILEKMLCEDINNRPDFWREANQGLQGQITFLPNLYFEMLDLANSNPMQHLAKCIELEQVPWTGEYDWEPPKKKSGSNGFRNSQSNTLLSPQEKLGFIRKELLNILGDEQKTSLVKILKEIYTAHPEEDSVYVDAYIKILLAIAR